MPVAEPMTAEECPARPQDPAERGWELIGGELVDMHDRRLPREMVCAEISPAGRFTIALSALFGE